MEFVEEDRVELLVIDQGEKVQLRSAVEELKKVRHLCRCIWVVTEFTQVHPYEEVAYDIYKVELGIEEE